MTRRVTFWSSMFSKISDCTFRSAVSVLWNGLYAHWSDGRGRTLFIWSLNWFTDAFSVSLRVNGKLLTGLKLGKTSSMPSFFRRGLTRAFFHSSGKYPIWFEGICLIKVLIREAENRGIPSRAMLELGHCCTVYLVIVWTVSWHHPLSAVGKKGTYLLLSLAPLESWLVQDHDCPILFWFSESSS